MPEYKGDKGLFLRNSRDIEFVKQHGRRISTALFNLLVYRTGVDGGQVGIIVGRRFGNAVRRNRAKRIFRELVRQIHVDLLAEPAVLVFPKRDALTQPFATLKVAWRSSFARHHLLRTEED
ncbi:MAG TPA: ribonuclease P protein component [Nitrospiraceae bacterium]|nr:ribonuclease P protein component [Nitrospiraceae bacterium]